MNEENNNILNEINLLRYISISHYIIIITSIYLNVVGVKEFFFSSKILYAFLKYSLILVIIFTAIPTLLVLAPLFKKTLNYLIVLKYLTFAFLIISFIVGILKNISVWKTSSEADSFYSYCPYHYSIELVDSMIKKGKLNSDICKTRSCFLYSKNEEKSLGYSYLCNYDSSKDFESKNIGKKYARINEFGEEIDSDFYIKCRKIKDTSIDDQTFDKYLNLCNRIVFYKCELFENPKELDFTSVNNKESCPGNNYEKTAFLLSVSFLIIDIICYAFLFFVEYLFLKKIIYMLQFPQNGERKDNQGTVDSTVKNNNNQQCNNRDNNNNESEFKKEPTETIIVAEYRNNENLIISSPRKTENEEIITKIAENKKDISIANLKKTSNIKLLNLFGNDKAIDRKTNLNDLEININNGNFNENENRRNINIKLTTNQETVFQSFDIGTNIINSPINKKIKDAKIKLNTIDPENSQSQQIKYQNQNQIIEEDEKENNAKGADAKVIRTKKILIRKLHLGD